MGSGQPLGSLAARLAAKVAKAEARQGMVPAPESALNFRPAVSALANLLSSQHCDALPKAGLLPRID